jgi:glycosyltransferase involved in cell wall biosynthesis
MQRPPGSPLSIAVVHEWLSGYAGSERVLEQILTLYPGADLFSVVDFLDGDRSFLQGTRPETTFIQRLPWARKCFRAYLPLMPLAIEGLDLSRYDLVISSSHAVAKGVLTRPGQTHICYCHTPLRYAWDLQHEYLANSRGIRRFLTRAVLHYLRLWDTRTSHGVDQFVANSRYIAHRIRKAYGRDAEVIHPPVDTEWFRPTAAPRKSFYFASSRFVRYKHLDLIVDAFSRTPERTLVVAGDGPERARIAALAGRNVQLVGHVSNDTLRDYMQRARAFIFAAEEDFGIVVAEAQACGTPVICYGRGGATEIVRDGETGVLFHERTPESLLAAIVEFEAREEWFEPSAISRSAQRFSIPSFQRRFSALVEAVCGASELMPIPEEIYAMKNHRGD